MTGEAALEYLNGAESALEGVARELRCGRLETEAKVSALLERARRLEKEVERLKAKLASGSGTDLAAGAQQIGGSKVVSSRVDGADAKALRAAVDQLKAQLKSAVIVLASVDGEAKITLVAGVTDDLVKRVQAGALVGQIAALVGGKGGGRPDFAQAGGTDVAALDGALAGVFEQLSERLSG